MSTRLNVTELLTPNVPVSLRTLKRRSGLKIRAVHAAVYQALEEGTVRFARPSEVGSNKYLAVLPVKWNAQKLRQLRGTPKLQNRRRQQMNIFMLV